MSVEEPDLIHVWLLVK